MADTKYSVYIALIGAFASIAVAFITTKSTIATSSPEIKQASADIDTVTKSIDEKRHELDQLGRRIKELESVAAALSSANKFGDWTAGDFKLNTPYQAKTDGFLAAYTSGNSPARGASLVTGPSPDKLEMRTRVGGSYDGAIVPVAKGQWWSVKPESSGTITILWLPFAM